MEIDGTDTSICPASAAVDAPVICDSQQLSVFNWNPAAGEYRWSVVNAFEKDIDENWIWINMDDPKTFTIADAPVVNYPTNTTTRVNPSFKWAPVEGADGYNLVVIDNALNQS